MSTKTGQIFLFAEDEDKNPHAQLSVLVPYPVDKAYDYAVPEGLNPRPGDYVTVPVRGREISGVVWGSGGNDGTPLKKLKSVVSCHELPPMPEVQRKFLDWVSHYTMGARGAVLKMSLSVPAALEPPKPMKGYRIATHIQEILNSPLPIGEREEPRRGEGEGAETYKEKPSKLSVQRSRELRTNQTDAEKKLWFVLKNRQLENLKFRRQHPIGAYIVDFVCLDKNLILELDGGQHDEQKERDDKRTKYLEGEGFKVIRFWNNEVLENLEGVLHRIIEASSVPPHPASLGSATLSPQGRGNNPKFLQQISPQRRRVLEVLNDGMARRPSEIAELAGCTSGVVKGMADKNLLEMVEMHSAAPCRNPDANRRGADLSEAQSEATAQIAAYTQAKKQSALLIDGVTGAGKTEVYFEAVAEALRQDKQVLILLPEIALSNAFLDRFKARFGCAPALWHSNLSPGQRRRTWRGVAEGQTKVVVGARSALFLPYADLGLIVVDEEHDPAYKQEDGVIYHARDMAVVRAHLGKIPIVLVSATPSLETMQNVWEGRYAHVHLPDRFGGARLPDIETIDLRADKPERQHFISPTLKAAVAETIEAGAQALLFLNRRGYAPLTLCRTCGHRMDCPRCTSWLVEHKKSARLHCHHCGFEMMQPKQCPECGDHDSFAVCGPGVERILEEVREYFPEARTLMMASDTADNNEKLSEMLADIRDHKVDIIVGTQIIAKGHHFPNLTLVGVIDADLGLQGGELRGAERTYQLLHQVAGRAGREAKKGKVYLQSFMPDHRIMKALAAGERDDFLRVEAMEREQAHMPPFSRLAGVIVSGRDEQQVIEVSKALGMSAPQSPEIQTLGPVPAPLARLRGKYRYRLLVRADKKIDLQKSIAAWVHGIKTPSTVRIQIDIDPQSFL